MEKHVHEELIKEWLEDISAKWQLRNKAARDYTWTDIDGQPVWNPNIEYQKKPREFQQGHWYKITDARGCNGVYVFNGYSFMDMTGEQSGFKPHELTWISDSLGELEFGE